jgi:hypothetical protein
VFGDKGIESVEMSGFLVVHVFHQRAEVGISTKDGWCLCGVDEGGSELAGLIDAELWTC